LNRLFSREDIQIANEHMQNRKGKCKSKSQWEAGCSSVVECLLSMCNVSSIPSTSGNKTKQNKKPDKSQWNAGFLSARKAIKTQK
jgi:hypothetical protein